MLYCEDCGYLYEGAACPLCGSRKGREPRSGDPCFLAERGQMECDMLVDLLKQNGIPSLARGRLGAGLTVYTGLNLEQFRIFVPYEAFEQAQEWMDAWQNGQIVEDENEEEKQTEEDEP